MSATVRLLENRRMKIVEALASLGPFRRGIVSVNYRRCGKPTCHCAAPGARGHGPQHLWNATIDGKSRAKQLASAEEIRRYEQETERYKEYVQLTKELVAVNEALCALPSTELTVSGDHDALKKKRLKSVRRRSSAKSAS